MIWIKEKKKRTRRKGEETDQHDAKDSASERIFVKERGVQERV